MIQNVLTHWGGIQAYGLVSLGLFFALFTGLMLWTFTQRKPHLERMSRLPLEPEADSNHQELPHE